MSKRAPDRPQALDGNSCIGGDGGWMDDDHGDDDDDDDDDFESTDTTTVHKNNRPYKKPAPTYRMKQLTK